MMEAAAVGAAIGFVGVAVYHVALVLGAPMGEAAWGGSHARLEPTLRVASAISALVLGVAAYAVLARARLVSTDLPRPLVRWSTWVLAGAMLLSAAGNLASRSRWERTLMAPVALILCTLCVVVSIAPDGPRVSQGVP